MRISICTPTHNMANKEFFLKRLQDSLEKQTFTDFEWVVTEDGRMAENTNSAIKKAKGEIVKILYMDDYLYDKNALQHIHDEFTGGWIASGCIHDNGQFATNPHFPKWNEDVRTGANTIGSPSVVAFDNKDPLLFDENLSWLLDCELYVRLFDRYGEPTLLNYIDVGIGIHDGQMTNILTEKEKWAEHEYIAKL